MRAPGHWSLEATPEHPRGAGPCAHFADRELRHPPPAVQKASRDSGVCAQEETEPAHAASGKAPQKAQCPPVCNGWRGGGGAECRSRSSRRTPEPPHHGGPRRVRAPGSTATRTLDSSWGGCASLNPLPMLSQGPPQASAARAARPPHAHITVTCIWAHGSPPGPGTGRRWFTRALPAPTTPYVQGREGCSRAKATMQGHRPLSARASWECGGVGA